MFHENSRSFENDYLEHADDGLASFIQAIILINVGNRGCLALRRSNYINTYAAPRGITDFHFRLCNSYKYMNTEFTLADLTLANYS
jgi:hypothetical protein